MVREGIGNFTAGSIASSGQRLSGAYAAENATLTASAFADLALVHEANDLLIEVVATRSFEDVADTPNQIATAGGLESLGAGHALYETLLSLQTQDEARVAFDALSGELHASTTAGLILQSAKPREAALNRLREVGPASVWVPILAYAGGSELFMDAAAPSGLWVDLYGGSGRIEGDGNAAQLDLSNRGIVIGATCHWAIGPSVSWAAMDGRAFQFRIALRKAKAPIWPSRSMAAPIWVT